MKASGKIENSGVQVLDNVEQCSETDIHTHGETSLMGWEIRLLP